LNAVFVDALRECNELMLNMCWLAGTMCFPASWTLSEKFMWPEQDMFRANWQNYNEPDLYQPWRDGDEMIICALEILCSYTHFAVKLARTSKIGDT
jgi:hypothetical protein